MSKCNLTNCDCKDRCPKCGGKVCPDCGKSIQEDQYIHYWPIWQQNPWWYQPWVNGQNIIGGTYVNPAGYNYSVTYTNNVEFK